MEKVDRHILNGNVISVNTEISTSCYGATEEKILNLLKKSGKYMEETDIHTWIQCELRCEEATTTETAGMESNLKLWLQAEWGGFKANQSNAQQTAVEEWKIKYSLPLSLRIMKHIYKRSYK